LSDEKVKAQYLEDVNNRDSIALARAGEFTAAEGLNGATTTNFRINSPRLHDHPSEVCREKSFYGVTRLSHDAVKRLQRMEDEPIG
jgi:hypothetical protein